MKKFIYCLNNEGGMATIEFTTGDTILSTMLTGWMSNHCKPDDEALERFINTSDIGQYQYHRLGICFRVEDI